MSGHINLDGAVIAFDLDGTLVDTAPDLHRALECVMTGENLPPPTLDDIRSHVGLGAKRLIERSSRAHGIVHAPEKLQSLTDAFIDTYAQDIAARSQIFEGVVETLEWLAECGTMRVVCTNKRTGLSNQLLEAMGLASHFQAVVGADSVENSKPHADHYLAAIAAVGGEIGRSMMIGDSATDVGAAKAAGVPVAVVSFGYTDTAPELLGADAVFSHYTQLPEIIVRLLNHC